MAEADKLNIDSIIQRLLEGKRKYVSWYLLVKVAILAHKLDNDSHEFSVGQSWISLRITVTFANSILLATKQTLPSQLLLIN